MPTLAADVASIVVYIGSKPYHHFRGTLGDLVGKSSIEKDTSRRPIVGVSRFYSKFNR
jgi:hypothetical protein